MGLGTQRAEGVRRSGSQLQGEDLTLLCPLPPNLQVRLCLQPQCRSSSRIPQVSKFPCPFWGQGCLCPMLVTVLMAVPCVLVLLGLPIQNSHL